MAYSTKPKPKPKHEAGGSLENIEGKVAVKHRQHVIATGYTTVPFTSPTLSNKSKEERVLEANHCGIEASAKKLSCPRM